MAKRKRKKPVRLKCDTTAAVDPEICIAVSAWDEPRTVKASTFHFGKQPAPASPNLADQLEDAAIKMLSEAAGSKRGPARLVAIDLLKKAVELDAPKRDNDDWSDERCEDW